MEYNKWFQVSIKQVENGFVVCAELGYLNIKEYITSTFEEAKNTAMRLVAETVYGQEEAEHAQECCGSCEVQSSFTWEENNE